ncbi:hypothetical protein H9W86_23195 (plasmid) [Enterobacter roggenkampii]|uniref:hypothetical protein n=1 Tax=Enterobacter roggenkampii TaxID=1812935 RepID=UPI001659FE0D|nr:hypothetical protein [Enterobacter roggenkampii]QNQ27500.1 hypothetical protein H9W86_23195 [Enterobacter roggenkampii]
MDIILPGNKSQARVWAETMINLEARKLVNTANIVGARHLGDGLTRLKFIDEIKSVINGEPAEFGKNRTLRFSGHP